jgi:hypothetical protein
MEPIELGKIDVKGDEEKKENILYSALSCSCKLLCKYGCRWNLQRKR